MKLQSSVRVLLFALALIAAFVAGQHSSGAVRAQAHSKWEYQIVSTRGLHSKDELIDKINKLGDDGWEAFAIGDTETVLLRRAK